MWVVFSQSDVLRLGEGGDFTTELSYEAHTSNLRKTVLRSTEPPLLPNRCYQLPFCPFEVLSVGVCRVWSAVNGCGCLHSLLLLLRLPVCGGKSKCECKCVGFVCCVVKIVGFIVQLQFYFQTSSNSNLSKLL